MSVNLVNNVFNFFMVCQVELIVSNTFVHFAGRRILQVLNENHKNSVIVEMKSKKSQLTEDL